MTARMGEVPPITRPLLRFFRRIVRGYFRRQFHAVRVSGAGRFGGVSEPLLVYANHSSWWDPMVAFLLAAELMPERDHYAPMDEGALHRYAILRRLGIFPVAMKTARGAVQFLRVGEAVLRKGGVLWITPQGRFVDARELPLVFKPGLAALAARAGRCTVLPLAIEYTFWDERLPECLLHFGEPVRVEAGERAEALEEKLRYALEETMADLKQRSLARDPAGFGMMLARGRVGTGGFYGMGQKVWARVRGRVYQAEHTVRAEDEDAVPSGGARR